MPAPRLVPLLGVALGVSLLMSAPAIAQPTAPPPGDTRSATAATMAPPGPAATGRPSAASARDPWERFNRPVFTFNAVLDHYLVKPVAEAYEAVVPRPVRRGVGNALGNLSDAWSVVNLVLQGKPARAAEMTMRVSVNTVLGVGGLLDIATEAGLERQSEDLGQTLAVWGVPSGPYLVLPLFGSSTLRDAAMFPFDRRLISEIGPQEAPERWRWLALQVTNARADALPFTRMLDTIALDKYTFVRDGHLTRRRSQIHDGNPPPLDDEESDPPGAPASK